MGTSFCVIFCMYIFCTSSAWCVPILCPRCALPPPPAAMTLFLPPCPAPRTHRTAGRGDGCGMAQRSGSCHRVPLFHRAGSAWRGQKSISRHGSIMSSAILSSTSGRTSSGTSLVHVKYRGGCYFASFYFSFAGAYISDWPAEPDLIDRFYL